MPKSKYPSKIDTSIETLKVQVREYQEKFNYYQVMVNKAEGALEVLMQLSDKKEEEPEVEEPKIEEPESDV